MKRAGDATTLTDEEIIARRLRARREELGLTQKQVADMIGPGVGRGAVGHWETGARFPGLTTYRAWAEALGLRMVVQLDAVDSKRIAVLVAPDLAEDVARLASLPEDKQAAVINMIRVLYKDQPQTR